MEYTHSLAYYKAKLEETNDKLNKYRQDFTLDLARATGKRLSSGDVDVILDHITTFENLGYNQAYYKAAISTLEKLED